jgi:hypothetical protein
VLFNMLPFGLFIFVVVRIVFVVYVKFLNLIVFAICCLHKVKNV